MLYLSYHLKYNINNSLKEDGRKDLKLKYDLMWPPPAVGYVIINLTGPNQAEVGMQNEYTCNAQCGMDCTVQWALHAGFPKGRFFAEGPRILWTPSDIGQTQVFTCITLNPGGGNIGQVSKTVSVVGEYK